MKKRYAVSMLALASSGALSSGKAIAQDLTLNVTYSQSAFAEGRPQVLDSIGVYQGMGVDRDTTYDQRTLWSTHDTYWNNGGLITPGTSSEFPTDNFFDFIPTPAQSADASTITRSITGYSEYADYLTGNAPDTDDLFGEGNAEYTEDCYEIWEGRTYEFGIDRHTTIHSCSAIDATLGLGNATFKLSAVENSANVRIQIPEIGVDFTSERQFAINTDADYEAFQDGSLSGINYDTFYQYQREDGYNEFADYMLESGKIDELANVLIGADVDADFTLGTLPTGGDFFALSVATEAAPSASIATAGAGGGSIANPDYTLEFGAASLGEVLGYVIANRDAELADFGLDGFEFLSNCTFDGSGTLTSGACDGIDAVVTLLGVDAGVSSGINSGDITLVSEDLGLDFSTEGATDREAAASEVADYVAANEEKITKKFVQTIQENQIAETAISPVAGNPESLQGQMVTNLLDFDSPNSLMFESFSGSTETSSESSEESNTSQNGVKKGSDWMVGGRIGTFSAGEEDGIYADIALEKGFRVGEGSRDRIKVSIPISFLDYQDEVQSSGSIRLGYEKMLVEDRWAIEPSIGVGYALETDKYAAGALWSAGISSLFKVADIGKGKLVMGNAVGYSESFDIESGSSFKSPEVNNISFRNGLSYQMPVGQRVFDRLGTLRASYTYTFIEGDELFLDEYHEASLSYGVGAKDVSARQKQEIARIGMSGTVGDDYKALSLNIGYRF